MRRGWTTGKVALLTVTVGSLTAISAAMLTAWTGDPTPQLPEKTVIVSAKPTPATVTVTASPPSRPPQPRSPVTGTVFPIQSQSGLRCAISGETVACAGPFLDGATGFVWHVGDTDAARTTDPITIPAGSVLKNNSAADAGQWKIRSNASGDLTFTRSGSSATFGLYGARIA